LNEAANGARSDDIGGLVKAGLMYVAEDQPNQQLQPAIPFKEKKSTSRGFKHPVLGHLLCPAKYISQLDADPEGVSSDITSMPI
jgi:hypothetical protein